MSLYIPRRTFLKASVAGALSGPSLSMGQVARPAVSANGRLNIAMIGAGGIAQMAYGGCRTENIVALADVQNDQFLQHAEKFPQIKAARQFKDFRVMLDKMEDQIDAVCVNTPDHTHFVATMEAMRRGKHVITQKPLTHNIAEARMLRKAAAKYNVVTNMAVQGHTFDGIRQMREWVEADVLGQVTEVHAWRGGPPWTPYDGAARPRWNKLPSYPPPRQAVPAGFDWDLWKGPVQTDLDYHPIYHPNNWRGFHAFGNGLIGDWMVHIANGPVWTLDLYEPSVIELEEVTGGNAWIVPDGNRVRWDFARRGDKAPCTMYWHNGPAPKYKPQTPGSWTWGDTLPHSGSLWRGTKGDGFTDQRSNKPRLANRDDQRAFKDAGYPEEVYPRVAGGPFNEWLRAIKGEGPQPGASFDFAARFTETCLLGSLAMRHGGRIEWDAENGVVTNRPELNAFVNPPVRAGWEYGADL